MVSEDFSSWSRFKITSSPYFRLPPSFMSRRISKISSIPFLALPYRTAFEIALEQSQDHWVPLRDVKAEGDFPREVVIIPWSEDYVKAPFAISKTGEIISDLWWDFLDVRPHT